MFPFCLPTEEVVVFFNTNFKKQSLEALPNNQIMRKQVCIEAYDEKQIEPILHHAFLFCYFSDGF